jgi:K+-sensing histidine kinase KdpD
VTIADDLPLIDVDEVRVRQIIRNLLSNAAKYSPQNTEIHITVEKKGDYILIGVKDHGRAFLQRTGPSCFSPLNDFRKALPTSPAWALACWSARGW